MKKKLLTTGIVCGCLLVLFIILLTILSANINYAALGFDIETASRLHGLSLIITPVSWVFTIVFGLITLISFVLLSLIRFGVLTSDLKPIKKQQQAKTATTPSNSAVSTKYLKIIKALQLLEKLHNDTFITDEEYEQNRKNLIARLY